MTLNEETASGTLLSFPADPYPTGWFQVAWSDDLGPADVRALHYFGQDLVAWRGQSGDIHVFDAHCLHFGAHLGVGGTVKGDEIMCPWHGWHWAADGRNTLIPYDTQPCKQNVQMKVWETREMYGSVLVWHDRSNRPPLWEPLRYPELDSGLYYDVQDDTREVFRVKAHVQNPAENAADFGHIVYVHGAGEVPEYEDYRFEGHVWNARVTAVYGGGKESTWLTPDGPVSGIVEFAHMGLGMGHSHWRRPLFPMLLLGNTTPVDDTHIDMFMGITSERIEGEERPPRRVMGIFRHQMKTVEQDFFTWENMKVLDTPAFTPLETKLWVSYRRWASQFYNDGADKANGNSGAPGHGEHDYRDIVVDGG